MAPSSVTCGAKWTPGQREGEGEGEGWEDGKGKREPGEGGGELLNGFTRSCSYHLACRYRGVIYSPAFGTLLSPPLLLISPSSSPPPPLPILLPPWNHCPLPSGSPTVLLPASQSSIGYRPSTCPTPLPLSPAVRTLTAVTAPFRVASRTPGRSSAALPCWRSPVRSHWWMWTCWAGGCASDRWQRVVLMGGRRSFRM